MKLFLVAALAAFPVFVLADATGFAPAPGALDTAWTANDSSTSDALSQSDPWVEGAELAAVLFTGYELLRAVTGAGSRFAGPVLATSSSPNPPPVSTPELKTNVVFGAGIGCLALPAYLRRRRAI